MIDLLKQVFDAREVRRYDNPDGTIMHAEVQIDDSVVMVADASEAYPSNKLLLHVYMPDVDAVFKKAIAAGCSITEPPNEREGDPDRRGSFTDFSGNLWAVGTQVKKD